MTFQLTLYGGREVDGVHAAGRELAIFVLLSGARRFLSLLLTRTVSPQRRAAVHARDVQDGDALQARTVGKIQRAPVNL